MRLTALDLDLLYAARDKDEYCHLLCNIVERLERLMPRARAMA
jgi:hypothetical protein